MQIRETDGRYRYMPPQEKEKSIEEYGRCLRILKDSYQKEEEEKYLSFAKGMRILIVEDNIAWQKLISTCLRTWEIKSISVRSGEEAALYMKEKTCDLMLVDQMLPDMEGIELIKQMKKQLRKEVVFPPVVMMISYEMPQLDKILKENEIFDYMIKPVDVRQIERVILNCQRREETEKTNSRQTSDNQSDKIKR